MAKTVYEVAGHFTEDDGPFMEDTGVVRTDIGVEVSRRPAISKKTLGLSPTARQVELKGSVIHLIILQGLTDNSVGLTDRRFLNGLREEPVNAMTSGSWVRLQVLSGTVF